MLFIQKLYDINYLKIDCIINFIHDPLVQISKNTLNVNCILGTFQFILYSQKCDKNTPLIVLLWKTPENRSISTKTENMSRHNMSNTWNIDRQISSCAKDRREKNQRRCGKKKRKPGRDTRPKFRKFPKNYIHQGAKKQPISFRLMHSLKHRHKNTNRVKRPKNNYIKIWFRERLIQDLHN